MSELQHGCGALPPWRGQVIIQTSHQGLQKGAGEHAIKHDDSQRQADRFCVGKFYLKSSSTLLVPSIYCPLLSSITRLAVDHFSTWPPRRIMDSCLPLSPQLLPCRVDNSKRANLQQQVCSLVCGLCTSAQCAVDYPITKVSESGNA